jgi:hypothetical protein
MRPDTRASGQQGKDGWSDSYVKHKVCVRARARARACACACACACVCVSLLISALVNSW